MTERTWHATITTEGWAKELPAEILIDLKGPEGGKKGFGRITPAEARRAAQELFDAADMVDPPTQLPEYSIYFRGYEIMPRNSDGEAVNWHRASFFVIRPPQGGELTAATLGQARQAVDRDIETALSPYARNVLARSPVVAGRELDRLQTKIGQATRALQSVSQGGMLEAKRILGS